MRRVLPAFVLSLAAAGCQTSAPIGPAPAGGSPPAAAPGPAPPAPGRVAPPAAAPASPPDASPPSAPGAAPAAGAVPGQSTAPAQSTGQTTRPGRTPPAGTRPPESPAAMAPPGRFPLIKPGDYRYVTGGLTKRYYGLHVPAGYDARRALPVVIVLHGRGGSVATAQAFGFDSNADRDRFFVVYPEAVSPARMWFTGLEAGTAEADDVAYLKQVLSEMKDLVDVDPRRIYAVGYSAGGALAADLAGALPGRIAAFSSVDANIAVKGRNGSLVTIARPVTPVSALFIHGLADHASPYAGGPSPVLGGNDALGAREGVAWWAETMGCSPKPKASTAGELELLQYSGCRDGAALQLTSYPGTHEWPQELDAGGKKPVRLADYIMDFFYRKGVFSAD